MEKKASLTLSLALALAVVTFGTVPAGAEVASEAPPSEASVEGAEIAATTGQDVNVTFAGLQITIDPETGRMREPTEEESAAMAQAMRERFGTTLFAETDDVGVTQHPDGMLSAVLGTSYLSFTMLRGNGDAYRQVFI